MMSLNGIIYLALVLIAESFQVSSLSVFEVPNVRQPEKHNASAQHFSTFSEENVESITDLEIQSDGLKASFYLPVENTKLKIEVELLKKNKMWSLETIHVNKNIDGKTDLNIGGYTKQCHYSSITPGVLASLSNCQNKWIGIIIVKNTVYVIDVHIKNNHEVIDVLVKNTANTSTNEYEFWTNASLDESDDQDDIVHTLEKGFGDIIQDYDFSNNTIDDSRNIKNLTERVRSKRDTYAITPKSDFCGVKGGAVSDEGDTAGNNYLAVVSNYNAGYKWWEHLVVELAVFVDQYLWDKFVKVHPDDFAYSQLKDFVATTLNNVQLFYQHESMSPKVTFKIVRYEVLKKQPYELSGIKDAQNYLNAFCSYQYRWKGRKWDHAIMLTGIDLMRWGTDITISGIAHVNGVCDPVHSCLLAEAFGFRAVFILAHEVGHGLGMNHDEPTCNSRFIMSESLGEGKVVWSRCSVNDFHKQLSRLNSQGRNCMITEGNNAVLKTQDTYLPGQKYNIHKQCEMSSGIGYMGVKIPPYTNAGICQIVYCKHKYGGKGYPTHPALEGTLCNINRYCIGGKCVPVKNAPASVNGGWSGWSNGDCDRCSCPLVNEGVSMLKIVRTCTNPTPKNDGQQCAGDNSAALLCSNSYCPSKKAQYGSMQEYMNNVCSSRKNKQNEALIGTGSQIRHKLNKACKIFCHVQSAARLKAFRSFGDYLPDGSHCADGKYCLDGKCTPLNCDGHVMAYSYTLCPTITKRCRTQKSEVQRVPSRDSGTSRATWTAWSGWSACSVKCGSGLLTRTRDCLTTEKSCEGHAAEKIACKGIQCQNRAAGWPVSVWRAWAAWGECSVTCAQGIQSRQRKCPIEGMCHGSANEESVCYRNGEVCPSAPSVATNQLVVWGSWSECSATCGSGTEQRQRKNHNRTQMMSRKCQASEPCAEWGGWGSWSMCANDRKRRRVRQCYGKGRCYGEAMDMQIC